MNIDKALVLSLFGGYTVKAAILGANLADAVVIVGLAAAHFLYNQRAEKKELEDIRKEIATLKQNELDQNVVLSELRTNVTGIKLSSSIRQAK